MAQQASKTEYAIAVAGLAYIAAFTTAEQLGALGSAAVRRARETLHELTAAGEADGATDAGHGAPGGGLARPD